MIRAHLADVRTVCESPWRAPSVSGGINATMRVPGSKSATARALVLSALADSSGSITAGLKARDTDLMIAGLRTLGAHVDDSDPHQWVVDPIGSWPAEATIDCGLAGTVMRFLPPVAAIGSTVAHFAGDEAASGRPIGPLMDALAQLGAHTVGGSLPISVRGPITGRRVAIDSSSSSQFISALLLSAPRFPNGAHVTHTGGPVPSQPHINMTITALRERNVTVEQIGDTWQVRPGPIHWLDEVIEPDLTTAAVFLAAGAVTGGSVTILDWPKSTDQPGAMFLAILEEMGASVTHSALGVTVRGTGELRGVNINLGAASELTPVVAGLAALGSTPTLIRGVGHIRGHETDRIAALSREITGMGGQCQPTVDGLSIRPATMRGGLFRTYEDHRMAHAAALIGLRVDGVVLDDVRCTSKTMPEFVNAWEAMTT